MRAVLVALLLTACVDPVPQGPIEIPLPEEPATPEPPAATPEPEPEPEIEAPQPTPEDLGDLAPLFVGTWSIVPSERMGRDLAKAEAALEHRPDLPNGAQVLAQMKGVMAMKLVVTANTLRFSFGGQPAMKYVVAHASETELHLELQGPEGKTERVTVVFVTRDKVELERPKQEPLVFVR